MNLRNGMILNSDGFICLIKHLTGYTYNSLSSGCTCYDNIEYYDKYINLSESVTLYVNQNINYSLNINDPTLCLKLSGVTIYDWFENYINYYSDNSGDTENRVIYDPVTSGGTYYLVEHTIGDNCTGNTENVWTVVEYDSEIIWNNIGPYYKDEYDLCDKQTGVRFVKLKDLNPISPTYNEIKVTDKCQSETFPIIQLENVNNISATTANFIGNVINDGGYLITERGFCFAEHRLPTIDDNIILVNGTTGVFNYNVSNLLSEKNYYVRAFAKNIIGLNYSNSIVFSTKT